MDIIQALENIKTVTPKFAGEEIICIRENKEIAIPTLLKYVKAVANGEDSLPKNDAHVYAHFLLAEFRVKEAFPYIIKVLEYDEDTVDYLLSGCITEGYGRIIASVATTDDISRIKEVIENQNLDEFQRMCALEALLTLYVEDTYSREELFAYLGVLLKRFRKDCAFVTMLVSDIADVYADEYFGIIKDMFKNDEIDETYIDYDFFLSITGGGDANSAKENLKAEGRHSYITDTIKSMSWWYYFNQKPDWSIKIGRNEPCPCGSGKKFKKCCIDKV